MTQTLCLLACLAATFFMTGVIVFVHVVHYPLFNATGPEAFAAYHREHVRLTGYVVMVPMVVELATAALLAWSPPAGSGPRLAWAGLGAAALTWGVTAFYSVPCHNRLAMGFDPATHARLVSTNALRVVAWGAHSAVVLVMAARAMR